ncbi:hypothetical protein GQ44DRAFT_732143 [Phaeosphaeriaceae sp. PMI808]|nr:hypothetical protein GQ44DRAFT_732143 [Phaeosphaeriaceae sp. PMI808]
MLMRFAHLRSTPDIQTTLQRIFQEKEHNARHRNFLCNRCGSDSPPQQANRIAAARMRQKRLRSRDLHCKPRPKDKEIIIVKGPRSHLSHRHTLTTVRPTYLSTTATILKGRMAMSGHEARGHGGSTKHKQIVGRAALQRADLRMTRLTNLRIQKEVRAVSKEEADMGISIDSRLLVAPGEIGHVLIRWQSGALPITRPRPPGYLDF